MDSRNCGAVCRLFLVNDMEHEITAIKVQKRNPERVSIYLDGDYAFGLSRIVAAWLQVGQRVSDTKIESLKGSDTGEVAYQKALRLLSSRPRTEKEVRERLSRNEFAEEIIEPVVQKLKESGLIADGQFAKQWVENRNELHPRSQRLIRMELRQKGIEDETIDQVLTDSADDSILAMQAAMQYARKLSQYEWMDFRKRLSAFLARRGFSYGTVAPVVQSVWESLNPGRHPSWKNEEFIDE